MNPDFYMLVIVEARGWVPGVQYTILPAVLKFSIRKLKIQYYEPLL